LRYLIYKKGKGEKAGKGKIAVIGYTLRFLNGNLCYSSDKEGLKEFKIGYGNVESGIEEGILLMHVGDRAKFIVPSHLAFGLLGDQNKIPQQATLVYDIELVKLK
jgi:FKBP-type peptidyl-prolyl cis-trans isomerase